MSLPPVAERREVSALLGSLERTTEELLLSGLAAASEATRQGLMASAQAASRLRLLRLGGTLRVASEEVGRFVRGEATFSRRRYTFFLTRAWMLGRGLQQALQAEDGAHWGQLTRQAASRTVAEVEVVSLGVVRRVVPGAFVSFEFRLRALEDGTPLTWSLVAALPAAREVPPEAFLHLPQAQGFKPVSFVPGPVLRLRDVLVSEEGRLTMAPGSRVEVAAERFEGWERFLAWDREAAGRRLPACQPGPFELDVELQEEVALEGVRSGEPEVLEREGQLRFPLFAAEETFHATVGTGPEDAPLREALASWREGAEGTLFGLLHFESCRFVLQPLTLFTPAGPRPLMLAPASFDAATLVRTLKFN